MITSLSELDERVWQFVETTVASRHPDRDITASSSILQDLVDTLTSAGTDDPTWKFGCRRVLQKTVSELTGKPELWQQAAKMLAIYLSTAWCHAHPRADMSVSRGQGGLAADRVHPVELKLAHSFLSQFLSSASTAQRIIFLRSLDEWPTLQALYDVLPSLDLSCEEMAEFLVHMENSVGRDGAFGSILSACQQWASRHLTTAQALVQEWLRGGSHIRQISIRTLEPLIEGAVFASHDHQFRKLVLSQLEEMRTKEAWELAVFVECHAWPEAELSDCNNRHAALNERVRRMPGMLVGTAIWALARDAPRCPNKTLETMLQLLALLPESIDSEDRRRIALTVVDVATRVLIAAGSVVIQSQSLARILDYAKAIPANWNLWPLDFFLTNLADVLPELVRQYLESWLEQEVDIISKGERSFDELLPSFADKYSELVAGWLLRWMVASRRELRFISVSLFGRRRSLTLPPAVVKSLSATRARALTHVLAGGELLPGAIWVPSLIALAVARPELLAEIRTILMEDALLQYPGIVRDALRQWAGQPWAEAANLINERLDANQEDAKRKTEIPELAIHPSFATWYHRQNEAMEEAMRGAHAQSIAALIATRIPIARGEGSSWSGDPAEMEHFSHFEVSGELPLLDLIDPVEAKLRRLRRNQEAQRLCDAAEAEDHARSS